MISLAVIHQDSEILEPSSGEGVFLDLLLSQGYSNITAYEIDAALAKKFPFVHNESFVSSAIKGGFDLIIGNPPYIRWKNLEDDLKQELSTNALWKQHCNSLCDYLSIFILKSIDLLSENGQLIFICPDYWMSTTHARSLRNYMLQNGCFEEIYLFNETPLFDKVATSSTIFKYVKKKDSPDPIHVTKYCAKKRISSEILNSLRGRKPIPEAEYLAIPQFQLDERWILQSEAIKKRMMNFEKSCQNFSTNSIRNHKSNAPHFTKIGDICDIGNGLVSGLDKAFQVLTVECNPCETNATIDVVKAKNIRPYCAETITKYIFLPAQTDEINLQKIYPNFYTHLQHFKERLENRYQYNRSIPYWEWAFLRNLDLFRRNEKRIFIPCKERISNKNYFRFAIVQPHIFPTQDVTALFKKRETKESIEYIAAYLNSTFVFEWLKINGIVKGNIVEFSEKPLSSIPFRAIHWNDPHEVQIHDQITHLTHQYCLNENQEIREQIHKLWISLLQI